MAEKTTVRKRPCSSCPYRRDVPSGIWAASEYGKLPGYDGTTEDQLVAGATGLFHCHQQPENLCAGWTGCHDMAESLAVRLNWRRLSPDIYLYESPVPLFGSGAEAAAHGMRDIGNPGPETERKIGQLLRLQRIREGNEEHMTRSTQHG